MFINDKKIIQAGGVQVQNGQQNPTPFQKFDLLTDFRFRDVDDFITFEVSAYVPSTNAATATNYPIFYLATAPCFLIEARIRHEVNGGSGATVDVEKLGNTIAKGSGGSMLQSKFSIASGSGTVQSTGRTTVLAGSQLVPGDVMALKATGTLTNASDVIVTILLGINAKNIPIGKNTTILVGYN